MYLTGVDVIVEVVEEGVVVGNVYVTVELEVVVVRVVVVIVLVDVALLVVV